MKQRGDRVFTQAHFEAKLPHVDKNFFVLCERFDA
jgi:hypothetical protein